MKIKNVLLFSLVAASILTGCTSVISKDVRSEVNETAGIQEVIENPDAFYGSQALWAGIIIDIKNFKDHTLVEVLQRPADYRGRPKDVNTSDGRFFASHNGFLDPMIYSMGRQVTVSGKIAGIKISAIGEYEYTYPVVVITEIHLWPVEPDRDFNYYYYPSYYHNRWRYW